MKIYFEEFRDGYAVDYLTPMKIYEVVDSLGDGDWVTVLDDEGEETIVGLNADFKTGSSWKILPEEPKTQSAAGIVASLESERSALANSIDSVNELLDSLSVPPAETLRERVTLALADKQVTTGTTEAHILSYGYGSPYRNPVQVSMKTKSGEVVYFKAELGE